MTIAVITETADGTVRKLACPARELVGRYGSLILWPRSATPIMVPFAWIYSLHFEEIASVRAGVSL